MKNNTKVKTIFVCNECGNESPKWVGKCPACGAWNSLFEQRLEVDSKFKDTGVAKNNALTLSEIKLVDDNRFTSGIGELDRVLGGGIVSGSLVLVGGDPGIGKSTLLLQMCQTVAGEKVTADAGEADGGVKSEDKSSAKGGAKNGTKNGAKILYASGEESQKQIKIRADRLGISNPNLFLISENNIDTIFDVVREMSPKILIIDSVQTVYCPEITSAPGSISQVREVTMQLMKLAKDTGICIFLVGHVTKEGAIAGPRVLEHMVDCVLYFEGERHQFHRILRAVKNRFGSTNEIGVFEMRDKGLEEVLNPSEMLLSGRPENTAGSCVLCSMEGSRPLLAEVQALITNSSFNVPRRQASGVDYNRISMLMAVLEKRVGLNLSGSDAYVNVIGGLKLDEPAVDLAVALAIASSFRNIPLGKDVMAIGEVGLTGEVRAVSFIEKRVAEAGKLGFKTCVIPKGSLDEVPKGVNVLEVRTVREAMGII